MTKKNNKKFHLAVDTGYHDSIGDNLIITMMQKRMTKKNKKSSTWRLIQDNYDNVDNNDNDGKNENNGKDKNNKKRVPPAGRYRMDPGHRYREAPHFGFGTRNA